ncbi:MAG: efflux transporter periplasmic adaptor subunit [Chitinophagaceae bacterium]|nr:efflux transporter periplasmic adaptor subunit [Chitinophagaceae bacterium]
MQFRLLPIALTAILLQSCGSKKQIKEKPSAPPPTVVDVMIARPETVSNTIEANGSVVANEYVELHPEIGGRITYLNVPEGKRIAKGVVIAKINDADLQAQLNKSRVQLDLAEKTVERYRKLVEVGGINQSEYDAALSQVNSYKADINIIQANISKTVLRAPFSGVVGLRQVSQGAYISPASVIATMQQMAQTKIDFTVPEEYAGLASPGKVVVVDMGTGEKHRAIVMAVEPQVNQTTRNIKVRALLQNGFAQPGSFIKVYLDAGIGNNFILVPANAIIPEARDKKLVLVKKGKAEFATVETGLRQADNVAILSGIKTGDTVVVSGMLFAKPKSKLKIGKVLTLQDLIKRTE